MSATKKRSRKNSSVKSIESATIVVIKVKYLPSIQWMNFIGIVMIVTRELLLKWMNWTSKNSVPQKNEVRKFLRWNQLNLLQLSLSNEIFSVDSMNEFHGVCWNECLEMMLQSQHDQNYKAILMKIFRKNFKTKTQNFPKNEISNFFLNFF